MQGRIHYYEGYDMQDVVLPLRVLHLLGAKTVILTNAVGAINESYAVGDFVVVEDHISFFVRKITAHNPEAVHDLSVYQLKCGYFAICQPLSDSCLHLFLYLL